MDPMNTYTKLINKHKGETAIIFGAGPSLYEFYQRKLYDKVKDNVLISVNSSIIIMPWDEKGDKNKYFWMSCDHLCTRWNYFPKILISNCTKVVRNSWEKYKDKLTDFLYFKPRPTSEGIINKENLGLCYSSSSVAAADMALQMGCSNIFLLGFDQCQDGKTGYHHFWQFLKNPPVAHPPAMGSWKSQTKVFEYNNMAYEALKGFAEYKSCKIYNVSLISTVTAFDKISYDEFEKYLEKNKK